MDFLRKLFQGKSKERRNNLILAFCVGILLLIVSSSFIPKNKAEPSKTLLKLNTPAPIINSSTSYENEYETQLENRLSSILSKIDGAGKVTVMVTTSQSKEIVVSKSVDMSTNTTNEKDKDGGERATSQLSKKETPIMVSNSSGVNEPLIITEKPPKTMGVIIVAEGGDKQNVKDGIIRCVESTLGIPSYNIQVFKGE